MRQVRDMVSTRGTIGPADLQSVDLAGEDRRSMQWSMQETYGYDGRRADI
jgi:hypothetical protein